MLRHRLQAKSLPLPNQRGTDTAELFPFTANRAHPSHPGARPSSPVPPTQQTQNTTPEQGATLTEYQVRAVAAFDAAVRAAYTVADDAMRSCALAEIAGTLAHLDLRRAIQLLERAEATGSAPADSHPGSLRTRKISLAKVRLVEALVSSDPAQAERVATQIDDALCKAAALEAIARSLARSDPHRAEQVALSITDGLTLIRALVAIAEIAAGRGIDRAVLHAVAEDRACKIIDRSEKTRALIEIARATTDLDQTAYLLGEAERTALAIAHDITRSTALVEVARALDTIDPNRAARKLNDALRWLQQAYSVATQPRKGRSPKTTNSAESIAVISEGLCAVAYALAPRDPKAALNVLAAIESPVMRARTTGEIACNLVDVDADLAGQLREAAGTGARSLPDTSSKAHLMIRLARSFASADPTYALTLVQEAEGISTNVRNEVFRAEALAAVGLAWAEL